MDPRSHAELGLREWVTDLLGPTHAWVRLDAAQGNANARAAVFGLRTADGRALIVKRYASARGFAQEHGALTRWFADGAGASPALGRARVPTLLAAEPRLAALLSERLPGQTSDAAPAHYAAGRFLAALHGLALADPDPLPLAEALAQRTRACSRRLDLAPALGPELLQLIAEHGPRPELFEGARRVPCHRDFAPRNWLWDGEVLAVIDFEHARLDLALVDLAKLCVGSWRRDRTLAAAFFRGYGRTLRPREYEQLRSVVVLHGVASVAWGLEHRQPAYLREGRAALAMAADWPAAL